MKTPQYDTTNINNYRPQRSQKLKRHLTVPSVDLIQLIKDNLSKLEKVLSQDRNYRNAYDSIINSKLNLNEAIATNKLFWCAYTPYYGKKLSPGWMYLGQLSMEDNGTIYAICSDWRSFPPDTTYLPIDMIPAEILAEALSLIDIDVDVNTFTDNPSYQEYIEMKFTTNCK